MRLVSIIFAMAWLPLSSIMAAEPLPINNNLPDPIATRQSVFSIPFQIDGVGSTAAEPVEVQLFVSGNRGATWQLYSKVQPAARRFVFRTTADGEYWFLVRTLNRAGQLRPQGTNRPELCVLIDTTQPRLQLQAQRGDAGQIVATWQVDETHPKPDGLSVQYRTTPHGPWQPVAIGRNDRQSTGATQNGEVAWWPQNGAEEVQVRAEVIDAAGNIAMTQASVAAQRIADTPSSNTSQVAQTPWQGTAPSDASTSWPATESQSAMSNPIRTETGHDSWNDPYPANEPSYGHSTSPSHSMAAKTYPPVRNRYSASGPETNTESNRADQQFADLPPGEQARMVNSRTFLLEYTPETSSYSTTNPQVELWGTADQGQTWTRFYPDRAEPGSLQVTTEREGIFGFRIITPSGSISRPPARGELPDVWVGVDVTRPQVRVVSAQRGSGFDSNRLIVTWQADDSRLTQQPVRILYRQDRYAAWTPIADGLENTGRYTWTLPPDAPRQVFVRIEVRDEAGNLGDDETPEPIVLDQRSPSGDMRSGYPSNPYQSRRQAPRRFDLR